MPRDGSGVWSDIPGITATSGATIESADWNNYRADLSTNALNSPWPTSVGISSGGSYRIVFSDAGLTANRTITMGDANVTLRPQSWEQIAFADLAGLSLKPFVGLSEFVYIRIHAFGVLSTAGALVYLRTSSDNGSNYAGAGTDYSRGGQYHFSGTSPLAEQLIATSYAPLMLGGGRAAEFDIKPAILSKFNKSGVMLFSSDANYTDNGANIYGNARTNGFGGLSVARNAFLIGTTVGTFTSGKVLVEGVRG